MSDYLVIFACSAEKELDSLPVEISSRISPRIDALADIPRPPDCVKLKAKQNQWRIRVGDYRVIYSINDRRKEVSSLPFQGEELKNFSMFQAPSFEDGDNPKSKIQNPKSNDATFTVKILEVNHRREVYER